MSFPIWWVALNTIVRKEIMRFMRIWVQTLIPPIITTTLYFVIFGEVMSHYIPEIHGFPYIAYIVPGLIMMSIMNNAYANVVSSFFGAKFQRHVEEILVSPTPPWIMLAGYVIGGVARGLVVGILVTGVSLFFTHLKVEHPALMLLILILTSLLFSVCGFLNALFAKKFDDISVVPTFVLTPLTYLGGIFYSIDLLSPAWQKISLLNPILYMINAYRYSCLGVSDIRIEHALIIIVLCNVVFISIAWWLLKKGIGIKN